MPSTDSVGFSSIGSPAKRMQNFYGSLTNRSRRWDRLFPMKLHSCPRWRRSARTPEALQPNPAAYRVRSWPSPRRASLSLLFVALYAVLVPSSACASDPVGIYAWVEKVVVEPASGPAERIQVWGAFAIAEKSGYSYRPAQP